MERAVKTRVSYEYSEESRTATIIFNVNKDCILEFAKCNVNIDRQHWSLDDWKFLGRVSVEIQKILDEENS